MRGRPLVAATCAMLLVGCMPVLSHGPEVRPGISESLAVGAGAGWPTTTSRPASEPGEAGWQSNVTFTLEPALRYGSTRRSPRSAAVQAALSVQLPAVPFVETSSVAPAGDLYVQLPDGPRVAPKSGAGFSAAVGHLMPYAMLGGDHWYTSQALALMTWPNARELMWLPGVALVESHSGSALHTRVQLGVPLRWYDRRRHDESLPRVVISGGFLWEWFGR